MLRMNLMVAAPPLSVLLPARDAAPWVAEAVDSVLRQTFGDFELVAVDDASTDGTGALLAEAARHDRRVRVVHGRGQGIVAALDRGLAECRAPLVARMDADDVSLPQRFAKQLEVLRDSSRLAAVGSQV